ncbi:hypothetical protein V8F33_001713 [Rhypophila sp. PSN 637]
MAPYYCTICETVLGDSHISRHFIINHTKQEAGLPNISYCEICSKLLSKCTIDVHFRGHLRRMRKKCKICGLGFSPKKKEDHKKLHDTPVHYCLEYECLKSPKPFNDLKDWVSHLAEAHGIYCKICKLIFESSSSLRRHKSKLHDPYNRLRCSVPTCRFTGEEDEEIFQHLQGHAKEKTNPINIYEEIRTGSPSEYERENELDGWLPEEAAAMDMMNAELDDAQISGAERGGDNELDFHNLHNIQMSVAEGEGTSELEPDDIQMAILRAEGELEPDDIQMAGSEVEGNSMSGTDYMERARAESEGTSANWDDSNTTTSVNEIKGIHEEFKHHIQVVTDKLNRDNERVDTVPLLSDEDKEDMRIDLQKEMEKRVNNITGACIDKLNRWLKSVKEEITRTFDDALKKLSEFELLGAALGGKMGQKLSVARSDAIQEAEEEYIRLVKDLKGRTPSPDTDLTQTGQHLTGCSPQRSAPAQISTTMEASFALSVSEPLMPRLEGFAAGDLLLHLYEKKKHHFVVIQEWKGLNIETWLVGEPDEFFKPTCYEISDNVIVGWANGYEDDSPLAGERHFPVKYLDDDKNP